MSRLKEVIREKKNFLNQLLELKLLNLPKKTYAITGGGPLAIRGLRKAFDIDIVVTEDIWNFLLRKYTPYDENHMRIGNIEIWKDLINLTYKKDEVINSAEIIEGYPFVSLNDTILWKQFLNRKKDQNDIKTIEEYLSISPGIYKDKPKSFSHELVASSCHIKFKDKFLFLQKSKGFWSEKKWGIPCGTVEENEDISKGLVREIHEEIGYKVDSNLLKYALCLYVVSPEMVKYLFHMFYYELKDEISVKLSNEHMDYKWVSLEDALSLDLIPGQKRAFELFLKSI